MPTAYDLRARAASVPTRSFGETRAEALFSCRGSSQTRKPTSAWCSTDENSLSLSLSHTERETQTRALSRMMYPTRSSVSRGQPHRPHKSTARTTTTALVSRSRPTRASRKKKHNTPRSSQGREPLTFDIQSSRQEKETIFAASCLAHEATALCRKKHRRRRASFSSEHFFLCSCSTTTARLTRTTCDSGSESIWRIWRYKSCKKLSRSYWALVLRRAQRLTAKERCFARVRVARDVCADELLRARAVFLVGLGGGCHESNLPATAELALGAAPAAGDAVPRKRAAPCVCSAPRTPASPQSRNALSGY